ncbi:MAG: Na(+)-translocating NADH-quinone reductase subunit F [Bacteroidota bacterium]
MNFPKRLDQAIQKLYDAFHNDQLVPECPNRCAVGNVCGRTDFWKHFTDDHGSAQLNYVGKVNELFGKRYFGYRPSELLLLEREFLRGCGMRLPIDPKGTVPGGQVTKEALFDGLCAAVSYLCDLDGLPNAMDYGSLFDFEPALTQVTKELPEPLVIHE